jgi:hypothetical protein
VLRRTKLNFPDLAKELSDVNDIIIWTEFNAKEQKRYRQFMDVVESAEGKAASWLSLINLAQLLIKDCALFINSVDRSYLESS